MSDPGPETHEKHRIRQRKSVTTCAKGGGHRELAARRVPGHRNTAFAGSRRLPCDEPAVCVQCIVGGSGKGIAWSQPIPHRKDGPTARGGKFTEQAAVGSR